MIQEGYTGVQITKITTQSCTMHQRWLAKNEEVLRYEEMYNIEIRWAPTMQEYEDGLVLVRECKYRYAIDDLERLVVQQLFEMMKLGMTGVGKSKSFIFPWEININTCCQVTSFMRDQQVAQKMSWCHSVSIETIQWSCHLDGSTTAPSNLGVGHSRSEPYRFWPSKEHTSGYSETWVGTASKS